MSAVFRDPRVPLAPEQLDLRKRVLKQIEADPGSFDMGDWVHHWSDPFTGTCNTTRCIAGWAQYLAEGRVVTTSAVLPHDAPVPFPQDDYVEFAAIRLLGLTEEEFYPEGADHSGLFFTDEEAALELLRDLAAAELPDEGTTA